MTLRPGSRRVALVTGVGRAGALGFEICRQLADRGLTVYLTARRRETSAELADRLRAEQQAWDVRAAALDVTDASAVTGLAHHLEQAHGKLDVLINNAAGVAPHGEVTEKADLAVARDVLEVTLFGAWRMSQAFLPLLRRSGAGRLVNVSSGAGSHGDPAFGLATDNAMGPSYAVAKAALNALTVKLAREERGTGILVNAVCPGFTATFPGAEAMGARPIPEGAAGIVWAALLPDTGPTGGFFRDARPIPW